MKRASTNEILIVRFLGSGPLRPFYKIFASFESLLNSSRGAMTGPFAAHIYRVYKLTFDPLSIEDVTESALNFGVKGEAS